MAIQGLIDFRYYGQAPVMDEDTLNKMTAALKMFHDNKHAILSAGVRKGKSGPIDNWHIPKLEFMQSVVASIRSNGVPLQWTADVTEHAHISEVKEPARSGNNRNYEEQICRYLDRRDKCARFNLATAISTAGVDLGPTSGNHHGTEPEDPEDSPLFFNSTSALLEQIEPVARLSGSKHCSENYFQESSLLRAGKFPNAPRPYRTFTSGDGTTAFHLHRDHVGHRLTVDEAAAKFQLPDLKDALQYYLHSWSGRDRFHHRRTSTKCLKQLLNFQVSSDMAHRPSSVKGVPSSNSCSSCSNDQLLPSQ